MSAHHTENFQFETLAEIFFYLKTTSHKHNLLNYPKSDLSWQHVSLREYAEKSEQLAAALVKEIGQDANIVILADSKPEWLIFDMGILLSRNVDVPIFTNISAENFLFQIEDADIKHIFIDGEENWHLVENHIDKFSLIITSGFKKSGSNIKHFDELLSLGKQSILANPTLIQDLAKTIKGDDLATIIYTSGSTGTPKGVELTHKNLTSQVLSSNERFPLDSHDIAVSYLPLAHIFQRMIIYLFLLKRVAIFFVDDVNKTGEIMGRVRPSLITTVPRFMEKLYDKIQHSVSEKKPIAKLLATLAFARANNKKPGEKTTLLDLFYQILVYKKLEQKLGGNLKMIISGGAALSTDLANFFTNIGLNIYQGYGLTEASPVIAVNYQNHNKIGTVGPAFPGIETKINEAGELLARGPNIMKGYHNNKSETEKNIDPDGFLHTGDLATIDPDGYITIKGRIKELFKTSTGKYVSPVPLEQELQKISFIETAVIIAENKKFVSALLFPNLEHLKTLQHRYGLDRLSPEDFCNNPVIENLVQAKIHEINFNKNHPEQIKKFKLIPEALSIDSGTLTPSLKIRRHIIEEKYKQEIEGIYKN